MKLGIIIPTYNNLEMLKVLIGQIYNYTQEDFLLVVVEDGQKDLTVDWLSAMGLKLKGFIPIFNDKNLGVAPSWNKGLKYCYNRDCTHFAVFNDDIELCPDWWERSKEFFKGNVHLVSNRKRFGDGSFFILDRTTLDKIGFFDEQFAPFLAEDTDYFRRYHNSGLEYGFVDIPVKHYGGTTTGKFPNRAEIVKQSRERFLAKWGDLSEAGNDNPNQK